MYPTCHHLRDIHRRNKKSRISVKKEKNGVFAIRAAVTHFHTLFYTCTHSGKDEWVMAKGDIYIYIYIYIYISFIRNSKQTVYKLKKWTEDI